MIYGAALHRAVQEFHSAHARGRVLSEAELVAAFEAAWTSEGFVSREHEAARLEAGREALRRFRSAQLEFPTSAIREFAKFVLENQPQDPPLRIAIVTPRDLDFGLARMFEVFRHQPPTEVRVFRDFAPAVAWARQGDA